MGDRTASRPVEPGKYCRMHKDGTYKYRFGSFRFSRIIPHHIRNHLETTQVHGDNDNDNDGVDINHRARSGLDELQSYELTVRTLNNLILLFRILLFYREASLCDSFYDAVGEDLGWPAHIAQETQDIFVRGRQLSLQKHKNCTGKLARHLEFFIDLVDEWTLFQTSTTARSSRTDISNHWSQLRTTWRSRFQSNPRSLLFTSPPRVAPTSSPSLPPPKSGKAKYSSIQSTESEQSKQTDSDAGEDWTACLSSSDNEGAPEADEEHSPSRPAAQNYGSTSQNAELPEPDSATTSTSNKPVQDTIMSDAGLPSKPQPLNAGDNGSLLPKPPAALDGGRIGFSSPILRSSNFPMPIIPPLRSTNKPSMVTNTRPTVRSSPILPSLELPVAVTFVSKAIDKPPLVSPRTATADSLNAIFGVTSKNANQSKADDIAPTVNAPAVVVHPVISSSPDNGVGTNGLETGRSPVKLPPSAVKVKEGAVEKETKDTKDTKDESPLGKSTTVYKARRTPSESTRRREGARYNAELANRMRKPEVANFVGALASAAIASALGSRPVTDVPVSPSLSNCSAASSPMFVSSHLNKREEQIDVATSNFEADSAGSSAKSDNRNPLGILHTGATTSAGVVAPNVEDEPSSRGEIPDQFVLPDYLRIKQGGGASSPGPVPKATSRVTSDTGINPGKKHTLGSSANIDGGSRSGTSERPRKRVSFGPPSYDNPEHQPMTPAQIAQTKRRSSLSGSAASTGAHSLLALSTTQPLSVSPPRAFKLFPLSPEKNSPKPVASPIKMGNTNASKAAGKTVDKSATKSDATAKDNTPDRLQKLSGTTTTHSPSKSQKTLNQSLLEPVKSKPMMSKSQATTTKAQTALTKLQVTTAKSQVPQRKLATAKSNADDKSKQQPGLSKPLTTPTKTQATPTKRLSSPPLLRPSPPPVKKLDVSAKARDSSPSPAPGTATVSTTTATSAPPVLQPRVHGSKDNETVLCDLRLREPVVPLPPHFSSATFESSEAERRANQAEAILEFIKAQAAAQLSCLQPLLTVGADTSITNSTDNDMLQCNLQAIRAQLDAVSYASRAALDRIKVKQKLQQQLQDRVQGQLLHHQQQQPPPQQEVCNQEQPHHQPLPQLRDKENDYRDGSV